MIISSPIQILNIPGNFFILHYLLNEYIHYQDFN